MRGDISICQQIAQTRARSQTKALAQRRHTQIPVDKNGFRAALSRDHRQIGRDRRLTTVRRSGRHQQCMDLSCSSPLLVRLLILPVKANISKQSIERLSIGSTCIIIGKQSLLLLYM